MWIVVCLPDRSIQIKLLSELWLDSGTMPLESSRPPCWQVIALLLFGHQRPFVAFFHPASQKAVISEIIVQNYCKVKRTDIHFYSCREIIKA